MNSRDTRVLSILKHWRFFKLPENAVQQCEGEGDVCKCGRKARCIHIPIKTPDDSDNTIDQTYTSEIVSYMLKYQLFFEVFSLLNRQMVMYMMMYCKETRRQYGKNVIVAFKGGNAFTLLFFAFVHALRVQNLKESVVELYNILKINDMDFEVFTDESFKNFFDVVDIAKLSTISLYDVRDSLLKSNVFSKITTYSDGSHANRAVKSDQVIVPVDNTPPTCPRCNTMVMPVPSILRSNQKQWYRPDIALCSVDEGSSSSPSVKPRCNTNLPISYNGTLKRLFGADVILLRMKKALRTSKNESQTAEIYDIAVPTRKDPIHRRMMQEKHKKWFYKTNDNDSIHVISPYYMYYSLRHTFFMEDIPPWKIFKLEKKLDRMIICLIMVAMIDENHDREYVMNELLRCARMLSSSQSVSNSKVLSYPFREFMSDLQKAFKTFGQDKVFIQTTIDRLTALHHIFTHKCRFCSSRISQAQFQKHLKYDLVLRFMGKLVNI